MFQRHLYTKHADALVTRTARIWLTTASIVVIITVALVLLISFRSAPDTAPTSAGAAKVLRDDSHRLNTVPGAAATFVEFLDFECEGCRAAHPIVEE